jgi:two-component system, OmpR family, response regulator
MPRILIADDEPPLLALLREVLELDGYQVTEATDTIQAEAILERESVDLVLTDLFALCLLSSPGELAAFRKLAGPIPVILMTGNRDLADLDPPAYGLAGLVVKPFDLPALLALLRAVLAAQAAPDRTPGTSGSSRRSLAAG